MALFQNEVYVGWLLCFYQDGKCSEAIILSDFSFSKAASVYVQTAHESIPLLAQCVIC